jgi:D-alanyl-D-alanine carboxypeptidase (penicillin-binding protein 5/6)
MVFCPVKEPTAVTRLLFVLALILASGTAAAVATPPPPNAPAAAAPPTPGAAPSPFNTILDKQPTPTPPLVNARSWVLMDHFSGKVLAENRPDEHTEPASLTKLMTAYVVFHALGEGRVRLTDQVSISEHAWRAEGSRSFVQVGTQVPLDVLLKGMIVQSGNDATIALAEKVGGSEAVFVQLMNEYAKRLGMSDTHFANSDGLPAPGQYSSARDLATLANALIREFPQYYPLFSLREFVWNNIHQDNRNGLLGKDPSVDGLKTGHTDSAGYCLASSANRNGMRLVSVVMGSPTIKAREEASAALLNYGYGFFETLRLKAAHDTVLKPRVYLSASEYAPVGVARDVYVTFPRGQSGSLHTSARLAGATLRAPLADGATVGEFTVSDAAGTVLVRAPLVALGAVDSGGIWTRLVDTVSLWFH